MAGSRKSRRIVCAVGVLIALVLCQGQLCGPVTPVTNPLASFAVVGSADATLDGTWLVTLAGSDSQQFDYTLVMTNGVPSSWQPTDGQQFILDGELHTLTADGTSADYTATGEAGVDGSSLTMKLTFNLTGNSETLIIAFTGTIAAGNTQVSGTTDTADSSTAGVAQNDLTFTMTKQ